MLRSAGTGVDRPLLSFRNVEILQPVRRDGCYSCPPFPHHTYCARFIGLFKNDLMSKSLKQCVFGMTLFWASVITLYSVSKILQKIYVNKITSVTPWKLSIIVGIRRDVLKDALYLPQPELPKDTIWYKKYQHISGFNFSPVSSSTVHLLVLRSAHAGLESTSAEFQTRPQSCGLWGETVVISLLPSLITRYMDMSYFCHNGVWQLCFLLLLIILVFCSLFLL